MLKHATFLGTSALALVIATTCVAQDATADTVVATVGDKQITLGEMIITRAQLPSQYAQFPDDVLFQGILEQLVQQQVLADSIETVSDRVEIAITNQRRSLLAGEVIDALTRATVTEEAVKAAYDAQFAEFEGATEYNAAHLLVSTEAEAIAAKMRIDAGAEFADVARELSSDSSAQNGGDLGWFGTGVMVAPFEAAVLALEAGQVSDPVESQFGWHVVKLLGTRNAEKPALDDVRSDIIGELQNTAILARIDELTKATTIVLPEDGAFDPSLLSDLSLLEPK